VAITAKDVQTLRQATGVGILDAKKALEANDGDMEEATKWLRVQGMASAAKRADREAGEGAVAVVRNGNVAAMVEMRCETDFVAKSDEFVTLVDEIAARVCAEGTDAVSQFTDQVEKMLTTLKENISVGRVVRIEAPEGGVVDSYLHLQAGAASTPWSWPGRGHRGTGPRHRRPHRLRPPPTSPGTRCPSPRWTPNGRRSRRSPATRASPMPRCPRSSRVA
jgi:translation elongation factor EF-Ts